VDHDLTSRYADSRMPVCQTGHQMGSLAGVGRWRSSYAVYCIGGRGQYRAGNRVVTTADFQLDWKMSSRNKISHVARSPLSNVPVNAR